MVNTVKGASSIVLIKHHAYKCIYLDTMQVAFNSTCDYLTHISCIDVFLAFYINSAPLNSFAHVCMHPLVQCSCCTILDIRMYAAVVTVTHWPPHKDIIE